MSIITAIKGKKISTIKPTPKEAFEGLKMLLDTIQENHKISEEQETRRKEIQALKETEIEKIRANKEVMQDYFKMVFSEREKNFDKLFERLDKGIEENNIELISMYLSSIVEVAKSSPLKELKQLRDNFHNDNVKEITI